LCRPVSASVTGQKSIRIYRHLVELAGLTLVMMIVIVVIPVSAELAQLVMIGAIRNEQAFLNAHE
jgi:hypothetical protein